MLFMNKQPGGYLMAVILLLASMASAQQLFGFGATCPSVSVKVTNVGEEQLGTLLAFVHSPEFVLFDEGERARSPIIDAILDNDNADDAVNADQFGVDSSSFICGGDGLGYYEYLMDDNDSVFPAESYDTFRLSPENTANCNCGNMRISILAAADDMYSSFNEYNGPGLYGYWDLPRSIGLANAAILNSHQLQSTSVKTHAFGTNIGLRCQSQYTEGLDCDPVGGPGIDCDWVDYAPSDAGDCYVRTVSVQNMQNVRDIYVTFDTDEDAVIVNGGTQTDADSGAAEPVIGAAGEGTYVYDASLSLGNTESHDIFATPDSMLVQFTPTAGASTSFLSLWALLMNGWY